jgi:hypothetical protein
MVSRVRVLPRTLDTWSATKPTTQPLPASPRQKRRPAPLPAPALERQQAYDATLARLAKAEEEARDAALARTDREQAVAKATTAALAPLLHEGDSSAPAPTDIHGAMLLQEAAALLHLHAQVIVVSNIRSLVHIVLDIDSGHYNRWCAQFLSTLGKFSLQDHIHLDASIPSLDWDRMDCVVKSWILDSLADDLAEIVSS